MERQSAVNRLRIATFNLESLDDRPKSPIDFADRVAALRPQLQRLRADILCLQEINAHAPVAHKHAMRELTALDTLVAGTIYESFHRVVSFGRNGQRPADHHNLVVMSRFPIVEHTQIWHDLVPPPQYRAHFCDDIPVEWDRPLLHLALDVGEGRRLHVVNVHLRAPRAAVLPQGGESKDARGHWASVGAWAQGFFAATIKAAGQALEARLLLERIFDAEPQALIAICGDFNSNDHEAPIRTLCGDEEDTGNGHLAARMLVPVERSIPESQRYSVIHHGRRVLLDHVLVSRPLLGFYLGCEIHNEALGDELVSPATIWGSPETYHAPVAAEFEVD